MFLDDDLYPYSNFLLEYMESYLNLKAKYGDNLVITLKGNIFNV
jgi:hypothetical protein